MAREGIYVGGKEVVQRYVGTQLVWEKRKANWPILGFVGTVSLSSYLNEMNIYNYTGALKNIPFLRIFFIGRANRLIPISLKRGFNDYHVVATLKNPSDFDEAQRLFDTRNGDIYMTFYGEKE